MAKTIPAKKDVQIKKYFKLVLSIVTCLFLIYYTYDLVIALLKLIFTTSYKSYTYDVKARIILNHFFAGKGLRLLVIFFFILFLFFFFRVRHYLLALFFYALAIFLTFFGPYLASYVIK